MALSADTLLWCVILLSSVQYGSAYCYGYCWYGSWYIWFAVIMVLAICCGAIGSFIRRRQIRKAMRSRQTTIVTVDINGQTQNMTSDLNRPYVYPPGAAPYTSGAATNQIGGSHYPAGTAPYPTGGAPYPAGTAPYPTGGAPYPTQSGPAPYPTQQYPVGGAYPGGAINSPPPYNAITTNQEEKTSTLPPSYQEAVRDPGGYTNHAATVPDPDYN